MKWLSDFRDPQLVHALAQAIQQQVDLFRQRELRPAQIMEVCGGHTCHLPLWLAATGGPEY